MSLFDVVQMECQRNAGRRALRIASGASVGWLVVDGTRIVDAQTETSGGEEAVLEMLGFASGLVEETTRPPFAVRETVRASWQSLLLRAAHAADERQRSITAGEASSPRLRLATASAPANDEVTRLEDADLQFDTMEEGKSMAPIRGRGVRLSPKGELVERRGDVRDLAERSAFVARLGDLLGAYLGLDRLVSVDAARTKDRVVVLRNEAGVLALEGPRELEADELKKEVFP
jgi:hypothetical protein